MAGARVGIDVGGTFTDLALALPARGVVLRHKVASTPDDPSEAVARGLAEVLASAGLDPAQLAAVTHGTTLGLNAIIQRRGARIALVVTEGYRDVLEIGRSRMPSSFDLHAAKEEPLVPRERVVEVPARLDHTGTPTRTPTGAELSTVAGELVATGASAAAVALLHGHTDPAFERDVTSRLAALVPGLALVSAAEVWPEVREYERTLVSCLNAYITPLMRDYFGRLERRLAALGVTAPIWIAASNGGSLSIGSAAGRPIESVLSGPAAGVTAAGRLAAAAGVGQTITFDMGGTSSDIAVTVAGAAEFATDTTIGGLPLILPVVAVDAIGAGGGSLLRVDGYGVLKVGPASAGAEPGPVAYGRGGTEPTVTDCYLVTGTIDPDAFLGGRMALSAGAARDALGRVAAALGLPDAGAAAIGALRVATAGMAVELQKTLARRGLDPADFTLVPYGGAGPTHAAALADEVGIRTILVPPAAATFCALGAAGAPLRRDFARSIRRRLDGDGTRKLREVVGELVTLAEEWLHEQGRESQQGGGRDGGGRKDGAALAASADLRYAGQAYELRVGLDLDRLGVEDVAEAFGAEHERRYGFRDPAAPIELGTARLAVTGPEIALPEERLRRRTGGDPTGPVPSGKRTVLPWMSGVDGPVGAAVYRRGELLAGDGFGGPAVVEQDDTTVVVPAGWLATVDGAGNLRLERS
jgi:N-methylhydantoinase A